MDEGSRERRLAELLSAAADGDAADWDGSSWRRTGTARPCRGRGRRALAEDGDGTSWRRTGTAASQPTGTRTATSFRDEDGRELAEDPGTAATLKRTRMERGRTTGTAAADNGDGAGRERRRRRAGWGNANPSLLLTGTGRRENGLGAVGLGVCYKGRARLYARVVFP
jgi:hypothetical protein